MSMSKIKVMHLIYKLGVGGAENGVVNLLNKMDKDRFSTSICAFIGGGVLTPRLDLDRITLFEIGKKPGNDFRLPARLFGLFRKWHPDIVHTHAWGTLCEGLAAAKFARVPVFIHGEHGTLQERKRNVLVQRLIWRLADQILSVSHVHARRLSNRIGFPFRKIKVLVNGVDSHVFRPKKNGELIRKKLNLGPKDVVIGTVGRMVPIKNQSLLIHSFSVLAKSHINVKLLLVGDGPMRGDLEKLVKRLECRDSVKFLGRRSDIPEIMTAMDIFALPSLSEGMSNTILEAMSSGLPVVAAAVGGNTELVQNCNTGLLTLSNNVPAYAEALSLLVELPELRKNMGAAGRVRVEEKFTISAMARNYERLYLKCLEKKTASFI
jgi:sugar transferase (PEP-CTERM/EpsH1 system associated)